MQEVNYNYNIRGWLTAINRDVTTIADENGLVQLGSGDLFAFDISYNQLKNAIGSTLPLYNGNISETFWVTANDNVVRQYGYEYDKLNRLKKANFIKPNEAEEEDGYNESINYDKNGNIMNLQRMGKVQFHTNIIDELTYNYSGNQLIKVTDSSNSPQGFNDGVSETEEYFYDANGNMTKDLNKGIGTSTENGITYNHLNLPTQINFANGNRITYLYNAVGQKLNKNVRTGNEYADTDYLSGFQYRSSYTETAGDQGTKQLQYFPHAEGYVDFEHEEFHYVYSYKDHLGNVRLNYTFDQGHNMIKILEENNYYPFGMKHEFYNSQVMNYTSITVDDDPHVVLEQIANNVGDGRNLTRYNSKEFQDELGLNVTAMDFRQYDNALGRFYGIDKMTEILPSLTPYRFAFNNPVIWSDPSGLIENGEPDTEEEFIYQGSLPDIVLTVNTSSEITRPATFSYGLMDYSIPHRRVSMKEYNSIKGTNYTNFDDYYFNEKYKPAFKDMQKKRSDAGKEIIMSMAVVVGSVFAIPVVISASPAIVSTVSTVVTNPSVQTFMYGGASEYAGANMIANTIGQSVANGGDLSKVNPVGIIASGFNGFGPILASSAIDLSADARNNNAVFNDFNTTTNNVMLNYLGNGAKNSLQLPRNLMSNASFATYQGMINTGVEAIGTGVSNTIKD